MTQILPVPRTQKDYRDLFRGEKTDFEIQAGRNEAASDREAAVEDRAIVESVVAVKRLMASGWAGKDLDEQIKNTIEPTVLRSARKAIKAVRRKYEGLVGRVYHDPSWFSDCTTAKRTLVANRQADETIVLRRISKCESCTLRVGSKCSLMGKDLVSKLEPVLQKSVAASVKRAVSNGEISSEVATDILASTQGSVAKIQLLNTQKTACKQPSGSEVEAREEQKQVQGFFGKGDSFGSLEPANRTPRDVRAAEFGKGTEMVYVAVTRGSVKSTGHDQDLLDEGMEKLTKHGIASDYWTTPGAKDWVRIFLKKLHVLKQEKGQLPPKLEVLRNSLKSIMKKVEQLQEV